MDIGCILTIGETIEDRQKEINFLNKKLKEYCNQLNVWLQEIIYQMI